MDNEQQYTFDLNLDFLDSSTTNTKNSTLIAEYQEQPHIQSTLDVELLANRIAKVNDMTIQLKAIKDENSRLQKQMQDFNESAMSIQSMYEQEKSERIKISNLYEEQRKKFEQAESQLTNKTLHFEQIQSRLELESADKKPIAYNDLALRYQRLAHQLDDEKQLHSKEKATLQMIKDYVDSKKLPPLSVLKKKSHGKVKSRDFSMQYNFKIETKSEETQCSITYCEEEPKDTCTQGTQYTWYTTTRGTNTPTLNFPKKELRNQGTQYISSTTTRGTSTANFIKTQSIGTNFPEGTPPVSIEEIFSEMIYDVSPLSPIIASPPTELKEEKVEMKSVGTNTGLKNVRKLIDYVVKNSDSRPPSRNSLYDRVKNETPLMGMPTINPFAGLGMTSPPMHNTVAELWNMLGHTIFALLQQNVGSAPLNPMHMNIVNDRMRNLNGNRRSEQQRCESQTGNDYFAQEYPRDYPTSTRTAATSPIMPSELEIPHLSTSSSFVPVNNTNLPVEIQKIILNKTFTEPVVSSSKKSSQVDKILQLFPEYSDSLKKRREIKKLLKASNTNKKPKKERSTSFSSGSVCVSPHPAMETQTRHRTPSFSASPQPVIETHQRPNIQSNWKTEIFGDSHSESSLDSTIIDYITAQSPEEVSEQKWTPLKTKSPIDESEWPISDSKLDTTRQQVVSPIQDEFLGFEEETNIQEISDEVFCKPLLPPKRCQPVIVSNSLHQKIQNTNTVRKTKTEPTEDVLTLKQPNPKRKRRSKKEAANQVNKIYKIDKNCILPETQLLKESQNKIKIPLSLKKTSTDSVNKPKRSLSLCRLKATKSESKAITFVSQTQAKQAPKKPGGIIKPAWMNTNNTLEKEDLSIHVTQNNHGPMVMKVEKPPDSIFQDLKTCLTNQKQDRYTKPFIGPILTNQIPVHENYILQGNSTSFIAPKIDQFDLPNLQSTRNMNMTLNSITNSSNPFNIMKYNEGLQPENTTKMQSNSITILNEQWIREPNPLTGLKQESPSNAVNTIMSPLEQKALDLENIPIYFVSDHNILTQKENLKTKQESPYHCENQILLPGFEEIQRNLKVETIQTEIKPTNSSQTQEKNRLSVSRPEPVEFNRLPEFIQNATSSFFQNQKALNTTESTTINNDVKPTLQDRNSYLVLNHQRALNANAAALSSVQSVPNCNTIDMDLCEESNVMQAKNNLEEKNFQKSWWANEQSNSLILKDEKVSDPIQPSVFTLQNQKLFGSQILYEGSSPEGSFECTNHEEKKEKESTVTNRSLQKDLNVTQIPFKFNEYVFPKEEQLLAIESSISDKNLSKSPIPDGKIKTDELTSQSSSDSECDLSIDFPPSPEPNKSPSSNLSAILKTPVKCSDTGPLFKTPDSCEKNSSIVGKALTNSTEKLVEDYLINEIPGSEGPKFQVFLDRILNEVAPPTSPISVLASSEKPNCSGSESSCDEVSTSPALTEKKYKRKAAATSAIAVKRSARIKAKTVETKGMFNSLCAMTISTVQLGKYTQKKTEKNLIDKKDQILEPIKKEKNDFQVGFFQEVMDVDDEEPSCEPIRHNPKEDCNEAGADRKIISVPEKSSICFESESEIVSYSAKSRCNSIHKRTPVKEQEQVFNSEPYLSLYRKTEKCLSEYRKSDELFSPMSPPVDSHTRSCKNLESSLFIESPTSPPPADQQPTETNILESFDTISVAVKESTHNTLVSHLVANYNTKYHELLMKSINTDNNLLDLLRCVINEFLSGLCLIMDTVRFVDSILKLTKDEKIIAKALVCVLKVAPRPETEVSGPIPDTYLSQTHRKLLTVLEPLQQHFPNLQRNLQSCIEQSMFTFTKEIMPVDLLMNLTQFYLAIIANFTGETNPARLFICKCLYFYNKKAIPMIYQTLCVYPSVLPQRIDTTYDRSDVLISTIQSILMSTYYDPEKCDFMTRQILAKLRMFYNYESFKPPRDEVIENMIAKIRVGRFKNVAYAFSLICKRMEQQQTEKYILNERLLPLANELYHTLSECGENDEKIACVLECISFIIKPFGLNTDISQYTNLFGRFLNAATGNKVIQEAAVAAILRTVRFGYVQCFNAIYNFKPTYELSNTLMTMLRSFVYKKREDFLLTLERQAKELMAK